MTDDITEDIPRQEKLAAVSSVSKFHPSLTAVIIALSIAAALLEGIGLSFLVPVIEIAQGNVSPDEMSGVGKAFVTIYRFTGVPFTLETVIVGVALVMVARYSMSFAVGWLRTMLQTEYIKHLQTKSFDKALAAKIAYFDEHGSDEILNAIVTQSTKAGKVINFVVRLIEEIALILMYAGITLWIAPKMTLITSVFLGIFVVLFRVFLVSGYQIGDEVADANERIQSHVQAGTQGIREVKLFGITDQIYSEFQKAIEQFRASKIRLGRNRAFMNNGYQLGAAIAVFLLIYLALTIASMNLATLGLFLFAIFRLAPRASQLSAIIYTIEGNLPHLIRTQNFLDELDTRKEVTEGTEEVPRPIQHVAFEDVEFAYQDEPVLRGLSFEVERGEFIAFVGSSGAGKSTIVSLLARLYEPQAGQITGSGTPIQQFPLDDWRQSLSVVRQDPHLFNETLRYNITLGNPGATEAEIREVCEIAQVTEFLSELPEGLDTELGDDGVRLSGGQRQRVAIARTLLKPADVLILDEATSDLDTNLEQKVHEGIETMTDYIMIVIAHRLSTVTNADRIYAMENGQIQESGPHKELLAEDGAYAELYSTQVRVE